MSANGQPFSTRVVMVLVVAGTLLAFSAILLSGFGDDLMRSYARTPGPLERNATGFAALRALVTRTGGEGALATTAQQAESRPHLLVLTPDIATRPEDVAALMQRRAALAADAAAEAERDGLGEPERFPTLVILPKWKVEAIPLARARVRSTGTVGYPQRVAMLRALGIAPSPQLFDLERRHTAPAAGLRPFMVPDVLVVFRGGNVTPLIGGSRRAAVLGRVGTAASYVLTDPDLLNNRGLKPRNNAHAALALLAALDPV